ncbi:restriction endonuclease subunit R [Lewinellaceae bacterium SD302]|nr:restriction endonuclease subunit R [Lewinellaceae bacterium SD302]
MAASTDPLDLKLDRFVPQLGLKKEAGKKWIKCLIRKQWLVLQPEEFVRQLLLNFLIRDMRYNRNRITVERGIQVIDRNRRTDVLIFDGDMRPFLLIECKAPAIKLDQSVFRQASLYNRPLRVPYLMISNGRQSYVAAIDYEEKRYAFLDRVPEFPR